MFEEKHYKFKHTRSRISEYFERFVCLFVCFFNLSIELNITFECAIKISFCHEISIFITLMFAPYSKDYIFCNRYYNIDYL